MKDNLVPIRFTFGRGQKGAKYPDFNKLPSEVRNGLGWSKFFDIYGSGMHYDKVDNLGTGHTHGTACVLVPEPFATAAAAAFEEVEIIDEAEFERFWNDRCTVHLPDEEIDTDYLQGLLAQVQLEKELGITPPAEVMETRKKALDPADKSQGVRKNEMKRWQDAKKKMKVEIHPRHRKTQ